MFSKKPYYGQPRSKETSEAIEAAKKLSIGDRVKTPFGTIGRVTEINRLTGSVRVKVPGTREESFLATALTKL